MDNAIRTVAEDDDTLTIEGLGIPFGGPFPGNSDSYGTRATKKTDFAWDLFPDRKPSDSDDVPARFLRPLTYQHGFDDVIGLHRLGGWSPMRIDKMGVWVKAQLDKHDEYHGAIRELLDGHKLAFSSSSVEHWADIPADGDWRSWPAIEMALTPTESNPWAQIAARSGAFLLRITGVRATDKSGKATGPDEGGKPREEIDAEDFAGPDKSYPIVNQASVDDAASLIGKAADPDAVKAKIIAIAKRKGLTIPDAWQARSAFRTASDDVAWASHVQSDLAYLMGCEASEGDQLVILQEAADALARFIAAETEEIGTDDDQPAPAAPVPPGMNIPTYMSATREGKRNAATDLAHIDAIHDHTVELGATAHQGAVPPDDESHQGGDAERTAAALPTFRVTGLERPNAKALRKALRKAARTGKAIGAETGRTEALRVLIP